MRRRYFIAGLGVAAAAWPLVARAQQPELPVIGYLSARTSEADAPILQRLLRTLNEAGFIEGRNFNLESRWAEYRLENLPSLAADLVRRRVAIIFAVPTPAAFAAKAATKSIPIVFIVGVDPVKSGLVASLARPGGNITGMSNLNVTVAAKRLELMHELLPAATLVGYFMNPTNPFFTGPETAELQIAASKLGVRLLIVKAAEPNEFEMAFATLDRERAGALVVSGEFLFISNLTQLVTLASQHQVPTVYALRSATVAGGLMSYGGGDSTVRQAAAYIIRILKGQKPADLPVQQSTIVELTINLKTAKALGLTFPTALLVRADAVIQ